MFIKKQRMIELQNVNLRLRAGGNVKKRNWYLILGMLLLVQLIAIFYFGSKKAGFHYDEYYSYYSSNVSIGLVPTDREWKPGSEIADEFRVLPGQRFQYGTVTRMQTYDVHPPFYYLLLHTVCSLFPGRFSKWSGIGLNIVLFVLSWSVLAKLTRRIVTGALRSAAAPGGKVQTCVTAADVPERITRVMIFGVCLLYGFNPAVYSGVMLVRMYMLLALWILLVTWLHVKSLQERKRGFSFYLPLMAVVYLGFLTHYYFAVLSVFPGSGNGAVSAVGTCRAEKLGAEMERLSHLCDCCDRSDATCRSQLSGVSEPYFSGIPGDGSDGCVLRPWQYAWKMPVLRRTAQ